MICGLWADKLALHMDQCLPGAGRSEEQMSMKQLAKLPRAAPGQTDARLPHGGICGGCSVLHWGSPSCSIPLVPALSWLLLQAWPPCWGQVRLLSLGSSQLPAGDDAKRGGGQAQLPRLVEQPGSSPLRQLQLPVVSAPIRK